MNRAEREIHAKNQVKDMEDLYAYDINRCVVNSVVYLDTDTIPGVMTSTPYKTIMRVENSDTVSAIFNCDTDYFKVAVLNFASYNNPGGGFLRGAMAQEEALCHKGILFNVLNNVRFRKEFYKPNHRNSNRGLYGNNLIYTPNVLFADEYVCTYVDVITCAAPNAKVAQEKYRVSENELTNAMRSRIQHILFSAYNNQVDVLILGAFGCGVFGNNPYTVARLFKEELETTFEGVFREVIFAIPNSSRNNNFLAFNRTFEGDKWCKR